jgi:hypothetical protein
MSEGDNMTIFKDPPCLDYLERPGLLAKFRKLLKTFLARHMLIIEFCKDCGRTDEAWHIDDWFWERVVGQRDGITLCLNCFDRRARAKGFYPTYHIRVEGQ